MQRFGLASLQELTAASFMASFDLGITPIQDVLAAPTSLAQAMALRATADAAVAASLATLTYISGRF
ncbi:MAG TPA: hypothetical protein VIT00_03175 [Terrimicrobiaceae bacterium]